MASVTNPTLKSFLSDVYVPRLKNIFTLIDTVTPVGDRGWVAEVTRLINSRLKKYDLEILSQYVSAWRGGKKVQRGGVDVPGVISIGLGIFPSADPNIAYAMVSLYLSGCWDGVNPSPKSVISLLSTGLKKPPGGNSEQLNRIETKIDHIRQCIDLQGAQMDSKNTMAFKLCSAIDFPASDVKLKAEEIFNSKVSQRLSDIFTGSTEKDVNTADYASIALFLSTFSGSEWSVENVENLLLPGYQVEHADREERDQLS